MIQEDILFTEVAYHWDLPKLYEQVEFTKRQQTSQQALTIIEKTCLRGLLCGHSPEQIASHFPAEPYGLIINRIWRLHRWIQTMTGREPEEIESYQDIPDWLEAAGYRKEGISITRIQHESELNSFLMTKEPSISSPQIIYPTEKREEDRDSSASSSPSENIGQADEPETEISSPSPDVNSQSQPEIVAPEKADSNLVESKQTTALTVIEPRHQQSSLVLSQHNSLPIVAGNDFLPPISRWTRLGGLFIVASIGVAIALATFTPYNVTVKAQAKIRPAKGLKVVEAETEGTIVDIRAKENEFVQKGEVIAVIDNSRLGTRRNQLESNIQQTTLQLQQIRAQISAQNQRISAETNRIGRAISSAFSQRNLRYREYQDRQITTNAQFREAQANLGLAQEELYQAQTDLTSAQANFKSSEAALDSAISRKDRYQTIAASGALSQNQLEEAQLEVEQRRQDVVAQKAAIERQRREIARRTQAIAAAQARLRSVRTALNPSNAEVAIATENIAQEQANGKANLASLRREKEALIQQGIQLKNQLERYTSELNQLAKDLQQTSIKASADGILFQTKLKNPGQTVLSGQEIARIAPSNTSLSIQALVPAQEIGNLEVGQSAQAKISACPYPDYGTLKGVVTKIAPDASTSKADPTGANFYEVKIDPESSSLKKQNKECVLQVGMEGVADITTKEETVLKFILRKARLLTDL